jgi:hypothetical protein
MISNNNYHSCALGAAAAAKGFGELCALKFENKNVKI